MEKGHAPRRAAIYNIMAVLRTLQDDKNYQNHHGLNVRWRGRGDSNSHTDCSITHGLANRCLTKLGLRPHYQDAFVDVPAVLPLN